MKKSWRIAAAAAIAGCAIAAAICTASAATDESYFTFENGVITGYTGYIAVVEIPATIGGEAVTAIGESAFQFNGGINTLTIPEGVTTISRC